VTAVPMQVLKMDKGLGTVLVLLGLFLFVGAVSIVGAAVRESVLEPGEEADGGRRARARILSIVAAALFALAVWGARSWWNSVDGEARAGIFKTFRVRTAVVQMDGRPALTLRIQDERRADFSPIMPDHGKLMHLFLIR